MKYIFCLVVFPPVYIQKKNYNCNPQKEDIYNPGSVLSCIKECESRKKTGMACVGFVMNNRGCWLKNKCDIQTKHKGFILHLSPGIYYVFLFF